MNEDNIGKITRLLEIGGTMLAEHCDQCGAPKFRYKGTILCPVCDQDKIVPPVFIKKDKKAKDEEFKEEAKGEIKKQIKGEIKDEVKTEAKGDLKDLELAVKNKLLKLAIDLDKEIELSRIKQEFECIEKGITVLKLIRES